jgi:hypothetical protein
MRRFLRRLFQKPSPVAPVEEHNRIRQARIDNIWHQVLLMEAMRQYGKMLENGELD